MSCYVVREGTRCPDCCGTGYTEAGICETCDELGIIGREIVYVRDGWLYLPDSGRWINGDHIVEVWRYGDPDTLDSGYWLTATIGPEPAISEFHHPNDVAAVTAWLKGRS